MNVGPSKLWSIIFQACEDDKQTFLKKWKSIKHLITISDLREKPTTGEHAGKSVLWLAAKAASKENSKPLKKIWWEFGENFTMADLQQSAQNGVDRNKSVFWLITKSTRSNNILGFSSIILIFNEIWERFINDISITDLRVHPSAGSEASQSVIWLLAQSSWHYEFIFFEKMWEKFKSQLQMSDLTTDNENAINFIFKAGLTPYINSLVDMPCYKPFHNLMIEILTLFPGEIPFIPESVQALLTKWPNVNKLVHARNDFFTALNRAKARQDYCQATYTYLLNLANLAYNAGCLCAYAELTEAFNNRKVFVRLPFLLPFAAAASNGHPEPFLRILRKFKDTITIRAIREGHAIFTLLALAAKKKLYGPLIAILDLFKDQLTIQDLNEKDFLPFLINLKETTIDNKLTEILSQITGIITDKSLLSDPRIRTRNDFCNALELAQHYSVEKLFELAEIVQQQGYLRAFNDLGEWLLATGQRDAAFEAFDKMSPAFKMYAQTNARVAEECFAIAVGWKSLPHQMVYLKKSLRFALKCHSRDRASLIEAISGVYVLKSENFAILDQYPQLMTTKSITDCFSIFDKIKEERQEALLTEKFKKLKIESPTLIFSDLHHASATAEASVSVKKRPAKDRL